MDEYGQLTFDLFNDTQQVAQPTELPLLEASIKKAQADMELFALDTEDKQAKQMYSWCANQMKQVHELVSPYNKIKLMLNPLIFLIFSCIGKVKLSFRIQCTKKNRLDL